MVPKQPLMAARWGPDGSRCPQDGSKMAPRWPKMAPIWVSGEYHDTGENYRQAKMFCVFCSYALPEVMVNGGNGERIFIRYRR